MRTSHQSGRSWVLIAAASWAAWTASARAAGDVAAERGTVFAPSITTTAEVWQAVGGGVATGGWWNTLVDASGHLSGDVVGAPRSSVFVAQLHWVMNRRADASFADYTGAFNAVSNAMANDHLRVFNLHYRQSDPDERWAFKLGQIAVDDDFMLSDHARLFANAAFGSLPSQVATPVYVDNGGSSSFPLYAVAGPGIWLQVKPSATTMWQFGLYHGGPGADAKENTGFEWSHRRQAGVLGFLEGTWHYAWRSHAVTSRLGAAAHTGAFDDFHTQRVGGGTRSTGFYSFYTVHDIVLLRGVGDRSKLGAFARAGIGPPSNRSVARAYGDTGVNWFGPVRSRPDDVAGSAISFTRFGSDYRALNDRAATETTVELTYQARLSARIVAQADIQFLFSPARHPHSARRETATVVGLRTSVVF